MKLRILSLIALCAAATLIVQAKVPGQHGQLARELGLSKSQKAEFRTIRQQSKQSRQPVAEQLKQNRQALSAAVKSGDTTQIQALSQKQGELQGQALAIRSQTRAKLYAHLTPDQRQKFDTLQQQKRKSAAPANN